MDTSSMISLRDSEAHMLTDPYPTDRHPVVAYLARLSAGSGRENMLRRLNIASRILSNNHTEATTFAWHQLTYVHLLALHNHLAATKSVQTTNLTLYAVKGVMKECWRLEYMTAEAQMRICDIPSLRGIRLPAGRALDTQELDTLLRSCREDTRHATGARDAALIALLYGLGLRRAEAVALDIEDYQPKAGTVRVRHGKGNKERRLYTNGSIAQALNTWLSMRGMGSGPLLTAIAVHGTILARRLVTRSVNKILRDRQHQAGTGKFTPHDLRRTFISNLLDTGVDLATVQQLAGHMHVDTTSLYDRRGERAAKRAMEKLDFPKGG
jgi:site-specific recombinase XerD